RRHAGHLRRPAQGARRGAHGRSRHHHLVLQCRRAPAGEPGDRRGARIRALSRGVSASRLRQEQAVMSKADQKPVTPRPAATVVILRDAPAGLEAFMVVRHHEIDFASGALVFPGGKVDAHDADPAWEQLPPFAAPAPERAFMVAAARETFAEAGLVLARRRGTEAMLAAAAAHRLVDRHRAGLLAGTTTFL